MRHADKEWRDQLELVPLPDRWHVGRNWTVPAKPRHKHAKPWAYILGSLIAFGALALIACPW